MHADETDVRRSTSNRFTGMRLPKLIALGTCLLVAGPSVTALINGTADANDPVRNAVAYVIGTALCSGSLVAPDLILTAGHCVGAPRRAVPPPGAVGDWENPRAWYDIRGTVTVRFGANRLAPIDTRQAVSYTLPRGADIILLRLDMPLPASVAIPIPVITQVGTEVGARSGRAFGRESFLIAGFGRTDFADTGPFATIRQVGSVTYWHANRCHFFVDGPGTGAADTVTRSGDSGGPLIWTFAGRRFVIGANQGFAAGAVSPEICGDAPALETTSRYTPTFRTPFFLPEARTGIGEWLEAMAPESVLPMPKGDVPLFGNMDIVPGSDLVVFRQAGGFWSAKDWTDRSIFSDLQWGGIVLDRPLIGNVGGDARDDLVIYRPTDGGHWFAKDVTDTALFRNVQWGGEPGDLPLLADLDGNGLDDVVIYRPRTGRWYARDPRSGVVLFRNRLWGGVPGDLPLTGDVDGDGDDDLVIYRRTGGFWYGRDGRDGITLFRDVQLGMPGDVPFLANVDDDPEVELVIYSPGYQEWFAKDALTGAVVFSGVHPWGWASWPGNVPLVADMNGDGRADLVVYRPDDAHWFGNDWRLRDGRPEELFRDIQLGTPR